MHCKMTNYFENAQALQRVKVNLYIHQATALNIISMFPVMASIMPIMFPVMQMAYLSRQDFGFIHQSDKRWKYVVVFFSEDKYSHLLQSFCPAGNRHGDSNDEANAHPHEHLEQLGVKVQINHTIK